MFIRRNDPNFVAHYTNTSRKGIVVTGAIGIAMYALYGVIDYLTVPDHYQTMWLIRLGVILFSVGMLGFLSTPLAKNFLRFIVLSISIAITLSVIWIWGVAYPEQLPAEITGITVTMLFCMAALRLLMLETIIYASIVIFAFFGFVATRKVEAIVFTSYLVSIPLVTTIGLAIAYLTEMYARKSYSDEILLAWEREKSDRILRNTFPLEIANKLRNGTGIIARREDQATVLFCDIIGFTEASTQLQPEELVVGLNKVFSILDRITKDNKCEKIKTIGDAYMAVSGVPQPTSDHAKRILNLALAITEVVPTLSLGNVPISVRIGIHSGPVVAGVIGESRFAYDVWGDTVNTASHMESTAPEGSIQITDSTKHAIADDFILEGRQTHVKGKGLIDTWLVISKKSLEPEINLNQGDLAV